MDPGREDQLQFAKHFARAQGWLLLDNHAAAGRALRLIPPAFRRHPEVEPFRAQLHLSAGQWRQAEPLLRRLRQKNPDDPQYWVSLAFAVRRAKSIGAAEQILLEARQRFPEEAVICFNLACYAAQLGRLGEVQPLLREAIRLDPHYKAPAKTDPDLAPYWQGNPPGERDPNQEG